MNSVGNWIREHPYATAGLICFGVAATASDVAVSPLLLVSGLNAKVAASAAKKCKLFSAGGPVLHRVTVRCNLWLVNRKRIEQAAACGVRRRECGHNAVLNTRCRRIAGSNEQSGRHSHWLAVAVAGCGAQPRSGSSCCCSESE